MMPCWAAAALILTHTVDIGVNVSSVALSLVNRAAIYCTNRVCERFAAELDDCCQLAETAGGR